MLAANGAREAIAPATTTTVANSSANSVASDSQSQNSSQQTQEILTPKELKQQHQQQTQTNGDQGVIVNKTVSSSVQTDNKMSSVAVITSPKRQHNGVQPSPAAQRMVMNMNNMMHDDEDNEDYSRRVSWN